MKTFVAICDAGYVVFAFHADSQKQAREYLKACRKRSDPAIKALRIIRPDDMGPCGSAIVYR
jgi:hypothetical protein